MNWIQLLKNEHGVQSIVEKSTEELLNELSQTDDIMEFAKTNEDEFLPICLTELLNEYQKKYDKSKVELIKAAGLDMTYGYQILEGRKRPKREKLLQLAFGFPLTIEETNRLLRAGGVNSLYVRCKRDAICMYCLQQKMTVEECDAHLYQAGEETLMK